MLIGVHTPSSPSTTWATSVGRLEGAGRWPIAVDNDTTGKPSATTTGRRSTSRRRNRIHHRFGEGDTTAEAVIRAPRGRQDPAGGRAGRGRGQATGTPWSDRDLSGLRPGAAPPAGADAPRYERPDAGAPPRPHRGLDDRDRARGTNERNGHIEIAFHARDVHLVMGPRSRERRSRSPFDRQGGRAAPRGPRRRRGAGTSTGRAVPLRRTRTACSASVPQRGRRRLRVHVRLIRARFGATHPIEEASMDSENPWDGDDGSEARGRDHASEPPVRSGPTWDDTRGGRRRRGPRRSPRARAAEERTTEEALAVLDDGDPDTEKELVAEGSIEARRVRVARGSGALGPRRGSRRDRSRGSPPGRRGLATCRNRVRRGISSPKRVGSGPVARPRRFPAPRQGRRARLLRRRLVGEGLVGHIGAGSPRRASSWSGSGSARTGPRRSTSTR